MTTGGWSTICRVPLRSRVSLGRARSLVRPRAMLAARSISPRNDQSAISWRIRSMSRRSNDLESNGWTDNPPICLLSAGPPDRRRARQHRSFAGRLRKPVLPAGNPHAGGEPPEVPFPGAGMRLVEVVQVENQVSFRRGVEPEVAQVGVTTDHRLDTRPRQTGKILSHERRSAAQKSVRRRQHPADPKGDQAFETPRMRLFDEIYRIGPVLRGPPAAEDPPWHLVSQRAAGVVALLLRRPGRCRKTRLSLHAILCRGAAQANSDRWALPFQSRSTGVSRSYPSTETDAVLSMRCVPAVIGTPIQRAPSDLNMWPWEKSATSPSAARIRSRTRSARADTCAGLSPSGAPSVQRFQAGCCSLISGVVSPSYLP